MLFDHVIRAFGLLIGTRNMGWDDAILFEADNAFICISRYLDSNLINGSIDMNKLLQQGLLRMKSTNSSTAPGGVVSVMNNNIADVLYDGINIEELATIIR